MSEIRVPEIIAEPLTEGEPSVRVPEIIGEPLGGGSPNTRLTEIIGEPLGGGVPNTRVCEVIGEPLTEGRPNIRLSLLVLESLHPVAPEGFMSTDLFPPLPGLTYSVHKKPNFFTRIGTHVSGHETRNAFQEFPVWDFELSYDYLPDREAGVTNLKELMGFFLLRQGAYDTFLFEDPDDYLVEAGVIGTGDNVTTQWYLSRVLGITEPIGQLNVDVMLTFLPAAVTTGADTITVPAHGMATGDGPFFLSTTGGLPVPLAAATPYWVIVVDASTIKIATSRPRAIALTAVDLTTAGTGTATVARGLAVYGTVPEAATVPATPGPYTITVTGAATYLSDGGVTLGGVALAAVAGAPAAMQYSVDVLTGVYTFNAAQEADGVVITYTYQEPATGWTLTMPNVIVFDVAPVEGTILSVDLRFYFVCRFREDVHDYEKFMDRLWQLQECSFRSVLTVAT